MTAERMVTWLLESSLVGFVVLGCGALAVKMCRQPIKRICLIQWTLVVAITTPLLLQMRLASPWSFAVLPAARVDSPPGEPEDQAAMPLDLGQTTGGAGRLAHGRPLGSSNREASEPSAAPLQFSPALPLWQTGILALYGLVMCVLLARLGIGIAARRWLYRSSSPASSAVVAMFGEMSGQPGRRVRLLVSDRAQSPVTWGLWRPVILLPSSWPKEKTAAELQFALAHEWSHIEQRDVSACYLALIAEFVCFYQPAFWWLRWKLALCQDHIADARAAERAAAPEDYASFLLVLARQRAGHSVPGAPAICSRRSHLFRRVSMLCSSEAIIRRCTFRWHITTATAALLSIAAMNVIRLKPVSADEPQLGARANDLPKVRDVWAKRTAALRSARLEYDVTTAAQALLYDDGPRDAESLKFIEFDKTVKASIEAGARVRYEIEGKIPGKDAQLKPIHILMTSDGAVSKTLNHHGASGEFPTGEILRDRRFAPTELTGFMPLGWFFGAFDVEAAGFALGDLPADERHRDGRLIGFTTVVPGANPWRRTYWLDPEKQFSIVRYTAMRGAQIVVQLDCEYQFFAERPCWFPVSWKCSRFSENGAPFLVAQVKLTAHEFGPVFREGEFSLEFPAGTVVSEARPRRQPKQPRAVAKRYVVRDDGTKREITLEDRARSHAELMAPDPPHKHGESGADSE